MSRDFLIESLAKKPKIQPLSPMPAVERDFSFQVPKDLPAQELMKALKKLTKPLCKKIKLFDVYEKGDIRALAFRLTLQSDTKTLTEEELKKYHKKLTQDIMSLYPIHLR